MSSQRRGLATAGVLALALGGCTQAPHASWRVGAQEFGDQAAHAEATNRTKLVPMPCAAGTSRVADGSTWTKTFESLTPQVWRSGDVGATAPLSDGRVLWVFGDTTRASSVKPRLVANSMLMSRGRCFDEVRAAGDGPVIPSKDTSTVCWPSSVLAVPMNSRDVVLVACSRIRRGAGDKPGEQALYDFTYRGMSLAVYSVTRGKAPALVDVSDVVPDSPDQAQINWGSAMVGDQGWVYIYGSQQPKGSGPGKAAYVARTRLAQVGGAAQWQYWNGTTFVSKADDARPFIEAAEGVSQAFSVVAWRGRFLLVSKQGGEFGNNIGIWSAPHPYGPWRGLKSVAQPYSLGSGSVTYQPLAHPEFPTPDGGLIVSMSRNTERVSDLYADPQRGRPMFFDIPIPEGSG